MYRYGFNGKENDPETNTQDYGMRIYDPRLGRFLSVDPISKNYPELTPYQFASNSPIAGSDLDGLEFENRTAIEAELAKMRIENQQRVKQKVEIQQRVSAGSLLKNGWRGVKDSYKATMSTFSSTSIRNTLNNAGGTVKDFGNMVIGKPGAAESFSERTVNFSMGISNSFSEPAIFLGTMQTRSANENAYGVGYYGFQFAAAYAVSRFFETNLQTSQVAATEFETLFRVQGGGSKTRFAVGANKISIIGNDMLFVNVGQESRAMTFLAQRGEDAVLVKFNITKSFVEKLRREAVPQNVGRMNPGKPQIVDPTKAPDQFGIPSEYFKEMLDNIEPKSIEVKKKGG